jgi:hypothetical protein
MKGRVTGVVAALGLAAAVAAVAAEAPKPEDAEGGEKAVSLNLGLDVASAYVWRGETLSAGPVMQPAMEVTLAAVPVTVGVWGNIEMEGKNGEANAGQFSEVDLYGSYTFSLDPVALSLGYLEYTYPGVGGDVALLTQEDGAVSGEAGFGESDREVSVTAEADVLFAPALSVSYGLGGSVAGDLYAELGLSREMEVGGDLTVCLTATLGYRASDEGPSGLSCWTAGAGASYGIVRGGVTYVGRLDRDVLTDEQYDVDFYGTLGVGGEF